MSLEHVNPLEDNEHSHEEDVSHVYYEASLNEWKCSICSFQAPARCTVLDHCLHIPQGMFTVP